MERGGFNSEFRVGRPRVHTVPDPIPDPEPASPSLPEPDAGVYRHEPGAGEEAGGDEPG